jgi:cyanate permease
VLLLLYCPIYGIGITGAYALEPLIWGKAFGRRHQGAIRARGVLWFGFSAAAGPWFAALVYDYLGSYQVAFLVFSALLIAAAACLLLADIGGTKKHASSYRDRE